jgi:hypothetical protein
VANRGIVKLIRFRRLSQPPVIVGGVSVATWEIAFDESHLNAKLNGEMAEVIMPAKSLLIRLWRLFFPLKGIEARLGETVTLEVS